MDDNLIALLGSPEKGRPAAGTAAGGSRKLECDNITNFENNADRGNLQVAMFHAKAGRPVFPCGPDKRPLVRWREAATCDPDQLARWWNDWPNAMPGLPTGRASGLAVLDLDIRPDKDGIAALRDMGLDPDAMSPCIVTTMSGGRHLYFRWHEGLGNSASNLPAGVDVRGEGGYVIAPGATGEAGAYSAGDPAPGELPAWPAALRRDAPAPVGDDLAALLGDDDDPDLWADYAEAMRERDWQPDRIRSALRAIKDASDRDTWLQIGMALHHASGGSTEGYDLWCRWSRRCPEKYNDRDQQRTWKSFGRRAGGVKIGTLYQIAKGYGWSDDRRPADLVDDDLAALLGESQPAVPASPLTFLSPADCAASNPRPYVIKGLIAQRDVACIVGAPGAGKSVLAPALAYAVAQGREAHGRRTKAGGVFYVAAEDEHGIRGRVTALRGEHGDADAFNLVGGVSDLLNEAVAGQGSPHFNALLKAVEERRPALIVIDTLSMSFPGLEENSAEGMGRVVAVARSLTKWGAAVVLIHHDTKDGQQGLPRGHSLLNGALDVSIHLRKDGDIVRGRLSKNRNGACDVDLAFSIRAVEIGRDEDGDTVTAPLCVPLNPNGLKKGPRLAPSERWALELVYEMMGDGDRLDLAAWKAKARGDGRITAAETPDARRKAVTRALQGLERHGIVRVVDGTIEIDDGIEWQFDDLPEDDEADQ